MKNNFRIIELPTHDVLLTKTFNNENEEAEFTLKVSMFFDGVEVNMSLDYDDEKTRNDFFNKMNEEQAQAFVDNVANQIG